jgi:hypothetical protein
MLAQEVPHGHLWLGILIVVLSGYDMGVAVLIALRDALDARGERNRLLVAYALARLSVVLVMFPIVKQLLLHDTLRTVPYTFDALMYVAGLALYALTQSYILYSRYGLHGRWLGVNGMERKEEPDGHR